ncbi:hypothetical protein LJB42_002798 [Komagataella kurtzmanii]|nr:hypothetical protein LJB42_002798 [Komagataella kurtzmanii]
MAHEKAGKEEKHSSTQKNTDLNLYEQSQQPSQPQQPFIRHQSIPNFSQLQYPQQWQYQTYQPSPAFNPGYGQPTHMYESSSSHQSSQLENLPGGAIGGRPQITPLPPHSLPLQQQHPQPMVPGQAFGVPVYQQFPQNYVTQDTLQPKSSLSLMVNPPAAIKSKQDPRAKVACIRCKKRKTKCTGGNPCKLCSISKVKCVYQTPGKRISILESHFRSLQDRIKFLENELHIAKDQKSDPSRFKAIDRALDSFTNERLYSMIGSLHFMFKEFVLSTDISTLFEAVDNNVNAFQPNEGTEEQKDNDLFFKSVLLCIVAISLIRDAKLSQNASNSTFINLSHEVVYENPEKLPGFVYIRDALSIVPLMCISSEQSQVVELLTLISYYFLCSGHNEIAYKYSALGNKICTVAKLYINKDANQYRRKVFWNCYSFIRLLTITHLYELKPNLIQSFRFSEIDIPQPMLSNSNSLEVSSSTISTMFRHRADLANISEQLINLFSRNPPQISTSSKEWMLNGYVREFIFEALLEQVPFLLDWTQDFQITSFPAFATTGQHYCVMILVHFFGPLLIFGVGSLIKKSVWPNIESILILSLRLHPVLQDDSSSMLRCQGFFKFMIVIIVRTLQLHQYGYINLQKQLHLENYLLINLNQLREYDASSFAKTLDQLNLFSSRQKLSFVDRLPKPKNKKYPLRMDYMDPSSMENSIESLFIGDKDQCLYKLRQSKPEFLSCYTKEWFDTDRIWAHLVTEEQLTSHHS